MGYTNKADIDAEIVFGGYGITDPALKYDDYKNIDVKNKIVLIFSVDKAANGVSIRPGPVCAFGYRIIFQIRTAQ